MYSLEGKRALVTGASKGIGKTIAIELGKAGAEVIVNYNSDKAGMQRTVDTIIANGGKAMGIQADVSDFKNIQRMFGELRAQGKTIDILVNNAGISTSRWLHDFTPEDVVRLINTNLMGAFFCSYEALKDMKAQGMGRIVNISSIHGTCTVTGRIPYATSKGGMDAMTRAMAVEFAQFGVRVNSIITGGINTERTEASVDNDASAFEELIPEGRWGETQEVAAAVRFLVSDEASYVNGANFAVDGGITARLSEPAGEFFEE